MSLLARILEILFPSRLQEAVVRSASIDSLASFVAPALVTVGNTEITTLLPYRAPLIKACIREAKFHGNTQAWRLLGEVLREYIQAFLEEYESLQAAPLVLIPIPLSARRLKERGYNQSERVAFHAVRNIRDPLVMDTSLLIRERNTAPQTSLKRSARKENMKGAFRATRPLNPAYTYIVIDDVATTGATLLAAEAALREAGAARIYALALAH